MKEPLVQLWTCLIRPKEGFATRAAQDKGLKGSLARLLLLRLPLALVHGWFSSKALLLVWTQLKDPDGPAWRQAMVQLPGAINLEDLRTALEQLPPAPAWERCWPWLPLLVPIGLLGLWLHDGAWDHAGLWLLRGLHKERAGRVRATLKAEAEALAVGSVGVLVGLLAFLPGVGLVFSLLALPLGLYLWCLRGVALAAYHGCPTWKGVAATFLHILLFGFFVCASLGLMLLLVLALAGAAG